MLFYNFTTMKPHNNRQRVTKTFSMFLLLLTSLIVSHTPPIIFRLLSLFIDVSFFWVKRFWWVIRYSPIRDLKSSLTTVSNYEDYQTITSQIDLLNGNDIWRQNFVSKKYDYRIISERFSELRRARIENDYFKMMGILRSGLLRNFGGISSKQLYNKSYNGTKILIEEYIDEVLECLDSLDALEFKYGTSYKDLTVTNLNQLKLDFFHDSRQALGTTALILQGGSLFGLVHLGVIKALYQQDLLPRVIAGSAVGALVGAFVCSLNDTQLEDNLNHMASLFPNSILRDSNSAVDVIEAVVKKGHSQDLLLFMEYVKLKLGDMTFEDAYLKTNKILNILVHPTDNTIPSLLNYITTPNVTLVSAIKCSLGNEVFKDDEAQLFIKTPEKQLQKMQNLSRPCVFVSPHQIRSINYPTSFTPISPYTRLTELFNVNHFIVSLARPYLAPLIGNDLKHSPTSWLLTNTVKNLFSLEVRHRLEILDKFGLLFSFFKWMAIDEKTPRFENSEITIVPELRTLLRDFSRIFDVNRYEENIPYWIQVGERSVWPLYPMLQTRCRVEFALDDYYNSHRHS